MMKGVQRAQDEGEDQHAPLSWRNWHQAGGRKGHLFPHDWGEAGWSLDVNVMYERSMEWQEPAERRGALTARPWIFTASSSSVSAGDPAQPLLFEFDTSSLSCMPLSDRVCWFYKWLMEILKALGCFKLRTLNILYFLTEFSLDESWTKLQKFLLTCILKFLNWVFGNLQMLCY